MRQVRNCKHCGGTVTYSSDDIYLCENCEVWYYRRKKDGFISETLIN